MSSNLYIDDRDLAKLRGNMQDFERDVLLCARGALKNLGARIIANAQTNLRRAKNHATGLLINSGAVKEGADNTIMAGFPTKYAYYVEFGRRAGKWPPFNEILQWVKIRRIAQLHDRQERKALGVTKLQDYITQTYTAAFLVQRSIGKKGTRPHPFLKPAYERHKPILFAVMRKAVTKVLNKDYTK